MGTRIVAAAAALLLAAGYCRAEVLTPPYFNLAEGKEIFATATCGVDSPGPELYCQLVGANSDQEANLTQNIIQGQQCDYCDPKDKEKRHPPEYAVDGTETWWQSPPLSRGKKYEQVNLTINLGQEFHVAYVYVRMGNSPRPGLWILEKSKDFGVTWSPWQYFSDSEHDCITYFGIDSHTPITRDDSVICTTEYSKIVPLEGGEIPISILNNRPSAKHYFNSTVLQEWSRATNVRFRFLKTKNLLGHLMSVRAQDPTVTRRYFYAIKDISIGGRCMCNGHAITCEPDPDNPESKKLLCECKHNTAGPQCTYCIKGFEQKKWRQSSHSQKFVCEPCNCFGHSNECVYDPEIDEKHLSLDINGNYEGGGVCQNCRHNTEGINCNRCKPKFYRPNNKPLNATDVCRPCECNLPYHTGNCFDPKGQCECREAFQAPNCDACSYGYFGFPDCRRCECNLNGTNGYHCEATEGQCPCKNNFAGHYCDICAEEYYGFPECKACECNSIGSLDNICEVVSGNCTCQNNYGGRRCDVCEDGYYNYPNCNYCDCDARGTEPGVCDKISGQCLCKEGYGGPRCDQCITGYFGYPNCEPCNCSKNGSTSIHCDASGKCSCLSNFVGRTCNQCTPGYYDYPDCISCNCDYHGSIGVSCDLEGKCQCRDNFDGDHCDKCKENFYNYPICEDCNCDPAGIAGTFQGCGSLPAGELCQCKERVEGRICNQCKKLYWNLQSQNPFGCEDCKCHIPGVIGSIGECDGKSGQCICKPAVTSRDCSECADGSYQLQESNLFGCTDCSCDIGGSIKATCNKQNGQCPCRSRIEGKKCDRPMRAHYFPTLHQLQYEAEDGRTPHNRSVRYNFDEDLFPNYSWKGYAVFSNLQNKIIHEIEIQKSSIYHMVLRYVNPNNEAILGSVTITPDSHNEAEQTFKVLLKPTAEPSFTTVAGSQGNLPSAMVMNPGHWAVSIATNKSLFLDYFVLLPAEYYEASILTHQVSVPCEIGYRGLCRHYNYPNLETFESVIGNVGYTKEDDVRSPLVEYVIDQATLDELGESKLPLINDAQSKINFELPIPKPGFYVLVISYITPPEKPLTATIFVEANGINYGKATLYPCKYTSVCRQVVTETSGKVSVIDFRDNHATIALEGEPNDEVAIKSVTAIPELKWSVDYISPKSVCVRKDGKCIQGIFPEAPDAKKIELELNNQIIDTAVTPEGIYDNSSKFIYLDGKDDSTIDVPAKVAPGEYVFVIQYYQPDFPEFNLNVHVQDVKLYEAKVPVPHCPSNGGCRSLVRQIDGSIPFQLTDNFVISLSENTGQGIWLDYILVIPADLYSDDYLKKLQYDQTNEFIKKCGTNHFYINTLEAGFCRESVFSLTTNYNNGAVPCSCDSEGSTSFECEKFGGQCHCKPNIIGRRCNICKTGFYGFPNCRPCNCPSTALCEPETGACICPPHVTGERCDQCEVGTYGFDPIIGCEECQCNPYGIVEGDRQCDLMTGNCKCKNNIVQRQCNQCKAGHYQFPYCEKCDCDIRGTTGEICDQETAECHCKENVQGSMCDLCKEGMFNLQPINEKGCSECFCFGKTTRCKSSTLYRTHIMDMTNWHVVVGNEKSEIDKSLNIKPQQLNETHIFIEHNQISINEKDVIYLSAPNSYLNKKLTSYGGWLNYSLYYTTSNNFGRAIPAADVIIKGADTFLIHRVEEQPAEDQTFSASVQLLEFNFETKHFIRATREQLMIVLADLQGIYIRATYWKPTEHFTLFEVSLDSASDSYVSSSELANSVEQCHCPPNYKGLSCEECAEGYYRVSGPYGGFCVECQCHGHASSCDVNTGICIDCKNGTTGDHCELCQKGYYGNATQGTPSDCLICACPLPIPSNNFADGCEVSEDGKRISCECQPGYYGARCESCAAGYYGQPEVLNKSCKLCECSGNINTNEIGSCDSVTGECLRCLNNTYGEACNLCAPGFFGDAVERKDCKSCYCDPQGMKRCDNFDGVCECHENVIGEMCDRCKDDHYGLSSGKGCQPCNCGIASESSQCADKDGRCKCKPGVEGRMCDRCKIGYWNYGPDGCTSCGCTSGYSRGTSCNPITGQCECLPGVLGEKCDHCPHRHILDERRGCQTCDKCIHDLLDVTDDLAKDLNPHANSFRSVSDTYFTNQRLDFINETVDSLIPEVKLLDPRRIDFEPIKQKISKLGNKAYQMKREVGFREEDGNNKKLIAEKNLQNSNDLELRVSKEVEYVNRIIDDVQALASNTDLRDGPRIDNALLEAQQILEKIKQVSFMNDRDKATDQQDRANILISEMEKYEDPVKNLTKETKDVRDRVFVFTNQVDDMNNLTLEIDRHANAAEELNFENKRLIESNSISSLKSTTDQTDENLAKAEELNENANTLYDEAEYNFSNLKNNLVSETSSNDYKKLNKLIDSNEQILQEVNVSVPNAIAYARSIYDKSLSLEDQFSNTRNLSGVRAAMAYQDIALNIDNAKQLAEDATRFIDNTTNLVNGLVGKLLSADENNRNLLHKIKTAINKTQHDLKPTLQNSRNYDINHISDSNDKNNAKLDHIEKILGTINVQSSTMLAQEALNNADTAEFEIEAAMNNLINSDINHIPDDLRKTKQLSKDTSDSNQNVSQANHQLDSMNSILPDVDKRLLKLSDRQETNKNFRNSLHDKIEDLKRKIDSAREIANRFRTGLTFFPNTTLELKNPESLPLQTTSTKMSVYFRTPKSNGLLLYLGNENRTKNRTKRQTRPRSLDYMALTIENGYPVLTLDLGSGPQKIIVNHFVADNVWRQLIVDRTGRNIKLIIREEDKTEKKVKEFVTEESVPGSHSIFDLDQEKSKLFVGGYPPSFQVPDTIVSSFEGEMEELVIGDVPVSFWNFVYGENNGKPCNERTALENNEPNYVHRFDRDGYVKLSKKRFMSFDGREKFQVQFKFKTWASNGLMYLMGGKKHFLALELRDGHILYQINLGDGQVTIKTAERYNDGNWHEVVALRHNKEGALKVDGKLISGRKSQGAEENLYSSDYVYFGGYPTSTRHGYSTVTQIGFEGCIDKVSFLEAVVDLTKNIQAHGVIAGCPAKFASLVSFDGVHPGYVKWEKVSVPNALQINLKFKTQSDNGVIYHLINGDGTPASNLSLIQGQLVFVSQGYSIVSNSQDIKFNDDRWHVVTATHNGSSLRLDIDDSEEKTVDITLYPRPIVNGTLYIGNVPENVRNGEHFEPFDGCVGDTTLNGIIINFANSTDRPHAHLAQCIRHDQESNFEDPSINIIDTDQGEENYNQNYPIESRNYPEESTLPITETQVTATLKSSKKPETVDGCRLPYYPATDPDQNRENAWRFGTQANSRFEYSTLGGLYKDKYDFQIDIKTLSSDGIIFYSSDFNKRDLVALYIKDGQIYYVFDCGSGPATLISKTKVNDQQWHTIIFKRVGNKGELIIDNQPIIKEESKGTTKNINIQPPFFVGGVDQSLSNSVLETISVNKSFSGCIRNFMLNGQHVGEPLLRQGVIPCSKRVEPGMFFYPGNGSNWFKADDKFNVSREIVIEMEIKPRSPSGLLFANHGRHDHVVLEMINGTVTFLVKAAKGQIETSYKADPNYLCDGNWHNIKAVRKKNSVLISVDYKYSLPGIGHNIGGVLTKNSIYIGGHPHFETDKPLRGSISRAQYVGCINNIYVNEKLYSLDPLRIHGNVMADICPTI